MGTAHTRMGAAGDLAEIKTGLLAVAAGGEHGVIGTDVRADAVGQGDQEPRAQRSRIVAWRQPRPHPLRVNRRQDVEVRGERDDCRCLARQAGVHFDLPIRRRQLPVRGGGEHIQQEHVFIGHGSDT